MDKTTSCKKKANMCLAQKCVQESVEYVEEIAYPYSKEEFRLFMVDLSSVDLQYTCTKNSNLT